MTEAKAPAAAAAFRYNRDARSPLLIGLVALWLIALFTLWVVVEARPWLLALLALPVLPALWEIRSNPRASLEIDDQSLRWSAPRSHAEIALTEIDHILLLTRWDFSIRATVHMRLGTYHHIPAAAAPKHDRFEAALMARGIPVKRQHFTLF